MRSELRLTGAPPLLGLAHDLSGGYTALWACIVVALGVAYGLTKLTRN